jgi:hypothetical protein
VPAAYNRLPNPGMSHADKLCFFFVEQTSSVVEHVYLMEALQKHSKRYQIQVTLTSWPRGVDDNNPTTAQSKCASTQQ